MLPVHIQDPVYGAVEFEAPLLVDLYHSAAVQRLAHIYQGGITAFINPRRATTRLDHSVGVAALLQQLGADLVEQAAGLIHDVPHTALSHVVDFAFPNTEHTYHEMHRAAVLAASDLPEILAGYDLDWQWVAEAENFTLLEQPLPALCADRLDYFMRDGVTLGLIAPAEVVTLLAHLQVRDGRIVVNDLRVARWLGERFMVLDEAIWCAVQEVGWYAVMGQALRVALTKGVLKDADLWKTDTAVIACLQAAAEPEIERWLALLRPDVTFERVAAAPDLTVLPKVRAIDPPVVLNGVVHPLSALEPAFARRRADYLARQQGPWGLKIISGAQASLSK